MEGSISSAARPSTSPRGPEAEHGALWNTIRKQLYKSEVAYIKRLVGEGLIQQNKLMWDELNSLKQMLSDLQDQNEELSRNLKPQMNLHDAQHRELLRRQAQIMLEDLQSQAKLCGHALEDLVPDLRNPKLVGLLHKDSLTQVPALQRLTPPATPSTRPSTSSGYSCGSPEPSLGWPTVSLGRQLGLEELESFADGIKEALEAENAALLVAIGEQMQLLEVETDRRAETVGRKPVFGEPSTAEFQQFVHRLQELMVSPSLRALVLAGPLPQGEAGQTSPLSDRFAPEGPEPILGGANVRRLKALISQRRRLNPLTREAQDEVPEEGRHLSSSTPLSCNIAVGKRPFDPFFDDPFG